MVVFPNKLKLIFDYPIYLVTPITSSDQLKLKSIKIGNIIYLNADFTMVLLKTTNKQPPFYLYLVWLW